MNIQERENLSISIRRAMEQLQMEPGDWINLANVGITLSIMGINFKQYGFMKLRPFLNEFQDMLEFKMEEAEKGKTPICYARLRESVYAGGGTGITTEGTTQETTIQGETAQEEKTQEASGQEATAQEASGQVATAQGATAHVSTPGTGIKVPTSDTWLFQWAFIHKEKIKQLADLALEERWYYGDAPVEEQENLPILQNYLTYTFKRLCYEGKVMIQNDKIRNEEYAAFNTGLVDRKYKTIYALFKKNTIYPSPYWYLLDFVVAGEDKGKTLNGVFNPLPERADYFENKIQNMLYDTTTGDLSCDYIHIITERTYRLPLDFLKENCPEDLLLIDGVSIDDVYGKHTMDTARQEYFAALGKRIKGNSRILNRLKNRMDDAVDLALKRVEWNYKTAIPMYFPTRNTGSLLLPLALVDEDKVDLALVVERMPSGAYQGQTILPLNLAYGNSRLVTRPDSDWLKTDVICPGGTGDEDE